MSGHDTEKGDTRHENFRNADMRNSDLRGRNLRSADLCGANLSGANLEGADLRGALLDSANFNNAILSGCNFTTCDFFWTDLISANAEGADFTATHFRDANLKNANLRGTHLARATICRSDLRLADLSEASFFEATLDNVILDKANFTNAYFAEARLCNLDLRGVRGLATTRHGGPSSLGIDTIFASDGKIPKPFLQGLGVPNAMVNYLESITAAPLRFYSCFISYSTKDESFAKHLYFDLQSRDIRCWLFAEDAKWGEEVWSEIDKSIKMHDKVIVVCSAHSLQSQPVCREIERALQREDLERRTVLFPVRLDNFIFENWEHPRKADVLSKVIGDFREPTNYLKSLNRLVDNLNKS